MTSPAERQRRRELFIVIGLFATVLAVLLLCLYWWGV